MSGTINNPAPPNTNTNRDNTELTQQRGARAVAIYQNNLELADPLQFQINRRQTLGSSSARSALQYARTTQISLTLQQQLATLNPAQFRITRNFSLYPISQRDFLPSDLGVSMGLWLDAADRNTVVLSGTNVTQWRDKSGLSNHATNALGNAATYSTNRLDFTGSMFCPLSAGIAVCTGFFVCGVTNAANVNGIIGATTFGGRQFRIINNVTQTNRQGISNQLTSSSSFGTISNNTTTITGYLDNGTTLQHYLNGTLTASGATGFFDPDRQTHITNEGFNGYVNEMIIFTNTLTTSQRQQIEGYLAWKWSLASSLPAGHPYKNAKPDPIITNFL